MKQLDKKQIKLYYQNNKELIMYLFFGALTFGISIVSFGILNLVLEINELLANLLSWIIAVLFSFFTNRVWVFHSITDNLRDFIKQMFSFFIGRVFTLLIEEVILFIFITWLVFPSMIVKIVAQIFVIILNYVISKRIIFKK